MQIFLLVSVISVPILFLLSNCKTFLFSVYCSAAYVLPSREALCLGDRVIMYLPRCADTNSEVRKISAQVWEWVVCILSLAGLNGAIGWFNMLNHYDLCKCLRRTCYQFSFIQIIDQLFSISLSLPRPSGSNSVLDIELSYRALSSLEDVIAFLRSVSPLCRLVFTWFFYLYLSARL